MFPGCIKRQRTGGHIISKIKKNILKVSNQFNQGHKRFIKGNEVYGADEAASSGKYSHLCLGATQSANTCSKLTRETLEQVVKYLQS